MPKSNAQTAVASYTRYGITRDDRVLYRGRYYTYAAEQGDIVALQSIDDVDKGLHPATQAFHWEEVSRLVSLNLIEIESGYLTVKNQLKRKAQSTTKIFELPPDVILRARMVSEFLAAEADVYETGEVVTRSDSSISKFILKFETENAAIVRQLRGGKTDVRYRDKTLVGPRQFRRLVRQFVDGGLDPVSLMPRHRGRKTHTSTFTRAELEYHQKFALKYQSTQRPTMKDCYAQMVEDNRERPEEKRIRLPSLRTFQRIINDLGDYENELGRTTNKERINRKYNFSQKGLQVTRPLEVVEMDEHKMDLVRLLVRNGIWDQLHPHVQTKIEKKKRAWLSVALDAYSRSVLGMRLLYADPNGNSAVSTLAMVARNKEKESALSGSQTNWPQCGTPEAIHTDAGASYISPEFQAAAMALTGRHLIPPSKHPHLRGRVERFFRTLNQRYVHLFAGQTFSNVLLRDEYDAKKHAHITHEELSNLLVRLIVDCYHNTVQRGLYGLTPLAAWYEGSHKAKGEVKGPPSAEEYRDIFAITDRRRIQNGGIEILGIRYVSNDLRELRKQNFEETVTIRINAEDISAISVKEPYRNEWFTVPAVHEGFKNTAILDWVETVRYIKARHGDRVRHSDETVKGAMAAVRDVSAATRKARMIAAPELTAMDIRHFERKDFATFKFSQRHDFDYGSSDESEDHLANAAPPADDAFAPEPGEHLPPEDFKPVTAPVAKKRRKEQAEPERLHEAGPTDEPPVAPGGDDLPDDDSPLRVEKRKLTDE